MIDYIKIENFKSLKEKKFNLKNLNILLGLNGQGKSSLIHSLLVLRQSDKITQGELQLSRSKSDLVNIGTSSDALYQYSQNNVISFEVKFSESDVCCLAFQHEPGADVLKSNEDYSNWFNTNSKESLFSNNFQYLNAQKIEPRSINDASLSAVMTENNLGKYGQYTAHYLELRGTEEIQFDNIIHPSSSVIDPITKKETLDKQLINQVNLWLQEISPGVSVSTSQISNDFVKLEYEFEQPNRGRTNKFKPENVGFGITYALPVITALLIAKPGSLLIIENPESHLHPRGQAELGNLISLVSQNDVQIIIETHSDHILNGIRVGIKKNPILKDRVLLYYFKKFIGEDEQFSSVTEIKIDKNGTLNQYPENLLDEWSNQLSMLIE